MLIRLVQTNRSVCSAIKLSSSRGIHQCSKQDIRRLSRMEDCCIFRVNRIRHEESTEARNKTVQEHYGRKMTMVLGWTTKLSDPKNLTSSLQELEGINICFSHIYVWLNISSSAHLWHCSKEFLHIPTLQLRFKKISHPGCRIHEHGCHSTNFYYNFGSKKTTQPFLNRKIPLPNKNQTNGEKFKMTSSGGFVF